MPRFSRRDTLRSALGGSLLAFAATRAGRRDGAAVRARPLEGTQVADGLVILPRSAWADAGRQPVRAMEPEDVRFLLVHHTASGNEYGLDGVVPVLRGAYDLHTGPDKGFADIAYNFLIDRFGTVWEGRAGSLAGPVTADATGGSQGFAQLVCLIGDFTSVMPSPEALDSLTRTLAWLADRSALDTAPGAFTSFVSRGSNRWSSGTEVVAATISGHRDMSSTACPGDTFYPVVHDQLQATVHAFRAASAPAVTDPPSTPAPTTTVAPTTVPSTAVPSTAVPMQTASRTTVPPTTASPSATELSAPAPQLHDVGESDHTPIAVVAAAVAVAAIGTGAAVVRRRSAESGQE